jgi:hypothetical protein
MNDPAELDPYVLKIALESVDTVLKFQAYTPGRLFVMLVGRFRDDLREALKMDTLRPVVRGAERHTFDALNRTEVDNLAGAVLILRQERFTRIMDDPELIRMIEEFESALNAHKAKRPGVQAPVDAKAS